MMFDFFPDSWIRPFGLTLIHSLWQALGVFILVHVAIALFRIEKANAKYSVGLAGLAVFIAGITYTFCYFSGFFYSPSSQLMGLDLTFDSNVSILKQTSMQTVVHAGLPWFVSAWSLGVVLFSLRFMGGLLYLYRLKVRTKQRLKAEWLERANQLRLELGVKLPVRFRISGAITSPMVMGVFKPAVLFPITMFSGLSQSQIETIICHELAHIKRYDFLVNMIQHVIEVIFFFNPFVWLLSALLRKEREHACDDLALARGGDAVAYVKALAQLQATGVEPQLALYFSNNNNNLLYRIKRLTGMKTQKFMEGRLLALLVVAVALMSFGWYSYQQKTPPSPPKPPELITAPNQVVEPASIDIAIPNPATEAVLLEPDTVPLPPPHLKPDPAMEEAFIQKFKEEFDEFYSENEEEIERLMAQAREEWQRSVELNQQFKEERQMAMAKEQLMASKEQMQLREEQLKHELEQGHKELQRLKEVRQEEMIMAEQKLKEEMQQLKRHEQVFRAFQEELVEALVEDGYIKKGESIRDLSFQEDNFEVNGKEIKEEDALKYEKLYDKHFGKSSDGLRIRQ